MSRVDLGNRLILVTRPQPEADTFRQLIEANNGRALLAPALEILPPLDPKPFEFAIAEVSRYDGIIITSANGARAFLSQLAQSSIAIGQVPPIFAVGKKTAQIIKSANYAVTFPDNPSGGIELAAAIKVWQPAGCHMLFPRAEQGREELAAILTAAGYIVDLVVAYRTQPITTLPKNVQQALVAGQIDAIPFFSGRTAQAFLNSLPNAAKHWLNKPTIITISQITKNALQNEPITVDLVAEQATAEGILSKLSNHWHPTS